MTPLALALVLGSAALHVIQHVALKRANDRWAFLWWMWLCASVIFLPVAIVMWRPVPLVVWALLAVSAVFEALYYLAITRAYRTGDLSLVYPLARGVAPLLLCVWTALLLNERPSAGGALGIALIVAGLCVVNLAGADAFRGLRAALGQSAARWALLAGLCISLYTTIDKAGVTRAPALLYTYLAMTLTLVYLTPVVLHHSGWQGLKAEWRRSWPAALLAGASAMSAYAIALYVMERGAPANYVGATREISVVFGAVIGTLFLNERAGPMRVAGAILITTGVAATGLFG